MTTYSASAVSDTVIAYKKSITLQVGRALRDNPIAMFEGAAGAPRLAYEALDTWYATAGGVGTYVFATSTAGADKAFGATIAGSSLKPTSALFSTIGGAGTSNLGGALSGTWQAMGTYDDAFVAGELGATLWLRIA